MAERRAAPPWRRRSLRGAVAGSAVAAALGRLPGLPPSPPAAPPRAFARASASVFGCGASSKVGTSTKIGGVEEEEEEEEELSSSSSLEPSFFLPSLPPLGAGDVAEEGEETLLDANDGDPVSCVATTTFASFEANEGGGSVGCGGGGGTEAAAAFFQEDGVSEEVGDGDDDEVDFAALDDAASGLGIDVNAAPSLPRSPPRRVLKTSPRSIERLLLFSLLPSRKVCG